MSWIDRIAVQGRFFAEMGWAALRVGFYYSAHLLPQALALREAGAPRIDDLGGAIGNLSFDAAWQDGEGG